MYNLVIETDRHMSTELTFQEKQKSSLDLREFVNYAPYFFLCHCPVYDSGRGGSRISS